jgi:hypothetical protein
MYQGETAVKHAFADGQYIRTIRNACWFSFSDKYIIKTILFFNERRVFILTERGVERIKAPYQGIT